MSEKRVLLEMDQEDIKKEVFWGSCLYVRFRKRRNCCKKLGINFVNVFTLKSNPNQVHSLLKNNPHNLSINI
jgi:Na+-transporting NADH:ubiquinone oxidoreductase subunit NqrE